MTEKERIRRYREADQEALIDRSKPSRYFHSACRFYRPFQKGRAEAINFFENTMVCYRETEKPQGDPDYVSDSGSCYWYSEDGVVRGSDHWGNGVGNCDWALKLKNGRTIYGKSSEDVRCFRNYKYGFAGWEDYICKTRLIEIGRRQVLTSFENMIGRDLFQIDGKIYKREWVETFHEIDEA